MIVERLTGLESTDGRGRRTPVLWAFDTNTDRGLFWHVEGGIKETRKRLIHYMLMKRTSG